MTANEAIETLKTLGFSGQIRTYEKSNTILFYSYQGHIASLKEEKLIIQKQFISQKPTINEPVSETN